MPEENVLIQPLPVERGTDGWWSHPDYLPEFDDEVTEAQFQEWCLRQQMETKVSHMEIDVPVEVFEAYMDEGSCDCSARDVQHPAESDWFILSIHDTEDGPVCIWGRRAVPVPKLLGAKVMP
ncbi:hypothetical protein M5G20_25980 [Pseudomonas sp. TNT2022 ID1044]|uniref:hypothetical protein n=1 Tax=Pseudomonas sp. TNT2022 ID1044 TaxID=2942636 RepID=UPI002361100E|nr:hypothetical protein [Pseudomonas sp. TNT2022 ID1044]MDD0999293.1 hypothetical protein [Pseudomonas sp. TNT2022 ID1044]